MALFVTFILVNAYMFSVNSYDETLVQELEDWTWKIVASEEACDDHHGIVYDEYCPQFRFIPVKENKQHIYASCVSDDMEWYQNVYYFHDYNFRYYKAEYVIVHPDVDPKPNRINNPLYLAVLNVSNLNDEILHKTDCIIKSNVSNKTLGFFTKLNAAGLILMVLKHQDTYRSMRIITTGYPFDGVDQVTDAIDEVKKFKFDIKINQNICPVQFCTYQYDNTVQNAGYSKMQDEKQDSSHTEEQNGEEDVEEKDTKQHEEQDEENSEKDNEDQFSKQNEQQDEENDEEDNEEQDTMQNEEQDEEDNEEQNTKQNEEHDEETSKEDYEEQVTKQNEQQDNDDNEEDDEEQDSK